MGFNSNWKPRTRKWETLLKVSRQSKTTRTSYGVCESSLISVQKAIVLSGSVCFFVQRAPGWVRRDTQSECMAGQTTTQGVRCSSASQPVFLFDSLSLFFFQSVFLTVGPAIHRWSLLSGGGRTMPPPRTAPPWPPACSRPGAPTVAASATGGPGSG